MNSKTLNGLIKYSNLLKKNNIKKIIEEKLFGYTLKCIENSDEEINIFFCNSDENVITINIKGNKLTLIEKNENQVEGIEIDDEFVVDHFICEKRPKGIIFSKTRELFGYIPYSKKELRVINLMEESLVLTNDKLKKLIETTDIDLIELYKKMNDFYRYSCLEKYADLHTSFSTRIERESVHEIKKESFPRTRTYLNSEEVSDVFDTVWDDDILYRIHDLYKGIINKRNTIDINVIRCGLLSTDAFDFKALRGITDKENELVGPSLNKTIDDEYIKNYLYDRYKCEGEIKLDRDSLIKGITYHSSWGKKTRKNK